MESNRERYMELGDFLKTRRQRLSPDQVGLPKGQRRRTSGLRREELAQLAGICATWYTYLEQGRPIRVSVQVLENLARILLLDAEERAYLFLLAHQQPPPVLRQKHKSEPDFRKVSTSRKSGISPALLRMLENMGICPAYILDQRFNVLAWNDAAGALFGDFFSHQSGRGLNMVWAMFNNPGYRQLFINWEDRARMTLAQFRVIYGKNIGDVWFKEFIEDIMQASPEFNCWWRDHDIQGVLGGNDEINHPEMGYIKLDYISLGISGNPNLTLQVYTPAPDTDTAKKIKQLLERNHHAALTTN